MAKDFFDIVNSYDPAKEVIPLAMKKFELDMHQSKLDMEKDIFQRAKDKELEAITNRNAMANFIKEKAVPQVSMQSNKEASEGQTATSDQPLVTPKINTDEIMNKAMELNLLSPLDYIKEKIAQKKGDFKFIGNPQQGIALADLNNGTVTPVMQGKESQPKGDFETFKAGKERLPNETDAQWNARVSNEWEAKQDQRAKNKIQVGIDLRNNANNAGGGFKPGTLDYMVEIYETTGQVPAMGMGAKAAGQRADFWNKVAERAASRGDKGAEQAARGAEYKSNQSALTELTKREQLIGTFTNRIDATSNVVLDLASKYKQTDSRLLNVPLNEIKSRLGSGEWQALNLALTSLSNEVAKVESGSLGIAEVSVEQAKIMKKIHDPNLTLADLTKVIDVSKLLGKTNMDSIGKQRTDLTKRITNIKPNSIKNNDPLGLR